MPRARRRTGSTNIKALSLSKGYAQMRKFNCWNISIVQQYARFKESRIRSAVFGNSRQFFLMRQNDRADIEWTGFLARWKNAVFPFRVARSEYAPLSPASSRHASPELSRSPRGSA